MKTITKRQIIHQNKYISAGGISAGYPKPFFRNYELKFQNEISLIFDKNKMRHFLDKPNFKWKSWALRAVFFYWNSHIVKIGVIS